MTDPQNPAVPPADGSVPTAPPAYQPPTAPPPSSAAAPPAYTSPQQPYAAAPPAAYGPPAGTTIPGRTMGIVAFILSFFAQLIALILGIIALVQSRKAGHKNGWALAAIIISSVLLVLGTIFAIIFFAVVIPQLAEVSEQLIRQCQELGGGIQEINGVPIDCSDLLDG
ncbi:MAG: DUF4190 domain-containing protein [Microbacterium sp.]